MKFFTTLASFWLLGSVSFCSAIPVDTANVNTANGLASNRLIYFKREDADVDASNKLIYYKREDAGVDASNGKGYY